MGFVFPQKAVIALSSRLASPWAGYVPCVTWRQIKRGMESVSTSGDIPIPPDARRVFDGTGPPEDYLPVNLLVLGDFGFKRLRPPGARLIISLHSLKQ